MTAVGRREPHVLEEPRDARDSRRRAAAIFDVYVRLRERFGHAGWWPGESSFEICLGAILTQNTAWSNVEKALAALRQRGLLSFEALQRVPVPRLARLIRSSGCYNVKARRVAAFLEFVGQEYGGRVERMAAEDPSVLRRKLLAVPGVGPETADSIALYAAGQPLFVVDAYTRRVFARLGLIQGDEPYPVVQRYFMSRLPEDAPLFSEYHAQIVTLGKRFCRTRPICPGCPLEALCPTAESAAAAGR